MTRANGVTTNYTYDNLSRLLSVLHQLGASTIDGSVYTFDSAGNSMTNANQTSGLTSNYTFDSLYELTQSTQATTTTGSYSYDAVGNRTGSLVDGSYSNNSSNELTSNSAASFAYDPNGNTTSKTDSTGTTSYVWDFENRLTGLTLSNSAGSLKFEYDPFGRRIEKISTATSSIFTYDGENLTQTVNAAGSVVARYAQTVDIDQPLVMQRSGTTYYYEADGLGSTTSLSTSTGALANTYTYDSFGNVANSTGSVTNFTEYTGREFDTETGLYYYRARYYNPQTGRFISEDPIEFLGGINFYAYVGNNPVGRTDPLGLDWLGNLADFSAGAGSALTLGLTDAINNRTGASSVVNKCSGWHKFGNLTGIALGAAIGSEGAEAGLKGLSAATKGDIGEGLSIAENTLGGNSLVGTEVPGTDLGLSTVFDSVWSSPNGEVYYVESKFGKAGLSSAQRAAAQALGDAYHVERWGYPFFRRVGGYLGAGATTAGAISGGCDCN